MAITAAWFTALAAVGAPAAAEWRPPETIATAQPIDPPERLAVTGNDRGRRVVAWATLRGIRVASARPGRPFGPGRTVPGSRGGYYPRLGVDGRGNVTVAWVFADQAYTSGEECCEQVAMSYRRAGGRFERARTVSRPRDDSFAPEIAVTPSGRVSVHWWTISQDLLGVFATRPGRFGRTRVLQRRGYPTGLRLDAVGGMEIAYERWRRLIVVRRSAGGRVLSRRALVELGSGGSGVSLGWDRSGPRAAAWYWQPRSYRRPDETRLLVATRSASGQFTRPRVVSSLPMRWAFPMTLAAAQSGAAVVAWSRPQGEAEDLRAVTAMPGGAFGAVTRVRRPHYGGRLFGFDVGVSAGGRAFAVWRAIRPNGSIGIYAARSSASDRFGAPRLISRRSPALPWDPTLFVDARGRATAAWVEGPTVRAARFRPRR